MNSKRFDLNAMFLAAAATALLLFLPEIALASNTETSGTAWDGPLTQLRNAFTGPIAFTISLLAIIIGGAMLAMGGEMNEFARRMIMVILAVALIVFANNFLGQFFAGGAEVMLIENTQSGLNQAN